MESRATEWRRAGGVGGLADRGAVFEPAGGRNNFTGSYTRRPEASRTLGFKFNAGSSGFNSSGQVPLDEVAAGRLDRFGTLNATEGGTARQGTAGVYYRQDAAGRGPTCSGCARSAWRGCRGC